MDLYLQSMTNGGKRNAPPPYQQGQRPPRMQPPPPPSMPNQQPNNYQNNAYSHQARPQPFTKPPPPPFVNAPGGGHGRGRPYDPGFARSNERQFVDNRNISNQRFTGGRGGYGNRGRGHSHQTNNYNDNFQSQSYQDNYDQRQGGRDQQHFNRNAQRNQQEAPYQNNRNQRGPNYRNREHSPSYQQGQRQQNQGHPRQRNDFRQNYQRNRTEQQGDYQQRPTQRNYEPQQRQRQYQRNDYPPRASVRGRGRGGERGRGRGRGRQMPPRREETQRVQRDQQKESQIASESMEQQMQPQGDQQSQSQYESEQSQKSGSVQQAQNGQQSPNYSQSQQQKSMSQVIEEEQAPPMRRNRNIQDNDEEEEQDMHRIDSMCSRQEFEERLQTFRMNNRSRESGLRLDTGRSFAIFEINKKTNEPDMSLTLKRFRRSTNRGENQNQQDQTADCPRSKKGLTVSLKHILKQIIDADGMRPRDLAFPLPPSETKIEFLHTYDFLWNRMRQMIKDVSRLQIKDRNTQEVITICQKMLRFFIIAVKQGRQNHACKLQFDPKMNLESITKILTQLLQIYQNNHYALSKEPKEKAYLSPNQPEIMAYAILISNDLQNTLDQKLRIRLDGYGIGHPLLNCQQISRALEVKKALKMRDYQSFYKILQSQQTDYVEACLLIHHLPVVRRQTLKIFQKSCEVEVMTKLKKIPLSILRRNLRFSSKLNAEFKQFISSINLKVVKESNQSYVILNEFNESLQDYICSYAFDFSSNKKNRKFYPKSKQKASLIDSSSISREQLVKRLWYQGKYVDECNRYYNCEDNLEEQQQEAEQQEQKNQLPKPYYNQNVQAHLDRVNQMIKKIRTPQPREQIKEDKNMNFLMQKKKEFARSKFVKSLQTLIQNLIKKSDVHSQHQRKRGFQILFASITMLQLHIKSKAFHRIRQFIQYQNIANVALQNLKNAISKQDNFMSSFNNGSQEYCNFKSEINICSLNEVADYHRKSQSKNLLNELSLMAAVCKPRKQLNVLVFFSSTTTSMDEPLSQAHFAFLQNLVFYMCGQTEYTHNLAEQVYNLCYNEYCTNLKMVKKIKQNDSNMSFNLTFHHNRVQKTQHLFLCGYDSVIFVDLHNNSKPFKKMIQSFLDKRKKIMDLILGQNSKLSIPITHLVVAKLDKSRQKNTAIGLEGVSQYTYSKHLLQQQSYKISFILRHSIIQALAFCMKKQQKTLIQVQSVSVHSLINLIQRNLAFLESELKEPLSIEKFQNYFNANIACIQNAIQTMAKNYQNDNWKDFLMQAMPNLKQTQVISTIHPYITRTSQKQQVDYSSHLSRALQFTHQTAYVLNHTKFIKRSQDLIKEMPYLSIHQALASSIQQYLSFFSYDTRQYSLQLICEHLAEKSCKIEVKQGKVIGQSKALINYIFVQLKKGLNDTMILLPKGFKFTISRDLFQKKQQSRKLKKIQEQIRKQIPKPEQIEDIVVRAKLNYKHQALLKRLRQQLGQSVQQENFGIHPKKAIKI